MSTTIDQKVVEMRFDNRNFEQNISTTMSSLNNLKDSLKMKGATQGLENINSAAKGVNMSGLSSAVEGLRLKFSALEVMGMTALANITNSAVNAGKRIVSALTIDPVKTGFSEYETQINAVQTILANTQSKGTTLDDVNSALDQLNAYADKTIYNFTEMTRNIGTFTAAGVDLDTSVQSIQGIANLAAISGSTSQQASTAMYQLSQALSSGTVKLMDWNSVVNAGMGGQVFQDALKETARVHGIAIDDMIEQQGSFRETLSDGWLTSEILTETLEKFTMTTEGLTEAEIEKNREMLRSKGYTEEQIDEIFKLGETATNAATKVKTFTQLWDTLKEAAQSGWTQTWEILVGDFEEAKELLTSISDSVGAFINSMSNARNNLLQGWKDLGGRTMMLDALKNIFQGILDVAKPIAEAFKEMFPPITVDQLMKFTEGFKNLTEKIKISDTVSDNIKRTFKGIFAVVDILRKVLITLSPVFGALLKIIGAVLNLTGYIGDFLVKLNGGVTTTSIFTKILNGLVKVVEIVCSGLKGLVGVVAACFGFLSNFKERMGQVGEAAGKMKDGVVNAFKNVKNAIVNSPLFSVLKALAEAGKVIFVGVGKALGNFIQGIIEPIANADFSGLMDIVNAFISGGLGLGLIKFINSLTGVGDGLSDGIGGLFKNLSEPFKGITKIFDGVEGCLKSFQANLKAETLKKIAVAVAILAASILVISLIDSEKLASSLGAITVLFADLMASLAAYSKIGKVKGIVPASVAMIGISVAVLFLASALKTVSDIDANDMGKGLLGVLALTAIVVGAAKSLSKSGKIVVKGATNMVIFALAIKILASVCEDLGAMDIGTMTKGLAGVGVLMAEIAIFLKNAKFGGNAKHVLTTGVALIAISAAMTIFASAMQTLSGMSWEGLGKGLVGMAGGLLAITIALNLMPDGMVSKAVGLIGVSAALLILSKALTSMGGMSWEAIGKGLLVLAGSMLILAGALYLMQGTLSGSFALLVAAGALALLAPIIATLGGMSWESIGKGLLAIAGAFVILGAAGYILAPVTGVILSLAGALALVGLAMLTIGVGVTATAIALGMLASMTTVAITSAVATINILITAIINLIPLIAVKIGEGIIAILNVIAGCAGTICSAVAAIIVAIIDALIVAIPPIIELIRVLLDELISLLIEYTPKLIDMGVKLLLALLNGISEALPDIIEAGVDIIVQLLKGIGEGIPRIIDAGIQLVIDFINGMADGIRKNTDKMIAAVNNLMDAFIGAIKAWFSNAVTKGGELISNVAEGVKSGIAGLKQAGKDAVEGFINGLKEKVKGAWNAAKEVGESALNGLKNMLGINSPSKEFAEAGRYSDEGLIKGLLGYSNKVVSAAANVGESALESMKDTMSGAADLITNSIDSQPTIRPVVDLSEVKSGASAIGSLLDMGKSVNVAANIGAVSSLMSARGQNGINSDLLSAIDKLRGDISGMNSNTYIVNGVTYDDGTNIATAVKSLVRAAKIERRM